MEATKQQSEITEQLAGLVRPHLKFLAPGDELPPDQSLGELGLDSMASIKLLLDMEEHFDITLPDEALEEDTFSTLASLTALIDRFREE